MKAVRRRNNSAVEIEDVCEPFCGSRKRDLIPLCDAHPALATEWCYKKNCGWGPEDFSHGSNVKVWWECSHCHRTYKAQISNRTLQQSGCPYCTCKKPCSDNSLAVLFPGIAAEWHPLKNKDLSADAVVKFSTFRAWWLCSICEHEWATPVVNRTASDSGCPACYRARMETQKVNHVKPKRKSLVLGETNISRDWYSKRGAKFKTLAESHPRVAREWHPSKNGNWTPGDFAESSSVKAWWQCDKVEDHQWQATITRRTKRNSGCPFCAGNRASSTNSLAALFPEIAKELDVTKNGDLRPEDLLPFSEKKVWWRCSADHTWEQRVFLRTKSGSSCRACRVYRT